MRGGCIQRFNYNDIILVYFTDCIAFLPSQTMVRFTNSVDDLKLFLHGLPPDCQESTLKDFLEGTHVHRLLNCWEPLFP